MVIQIVWGAVLQEYYNAFASQKTTIKSVKFMHVKPSFHYVVIKQIIQTHISIYIYIFLSIHLSIYPSIYLSIYLSIDLSIYLDIDRYIRDWSLINIWKTTTKVFKVKLTRFESVLKFIFLRKLRIQERSQLWNIELLQTYPSFRACFAQWQETIVMPLIFITLHQLDFWYSETSPKLY